MYHITTLTETLELPPIRQTVSVAAADSTSAQQTALEHAEATLKTIARELGLAGVECLCISVEGVRHDF